MDTTAPVCTVRIHWRGLSASNRLVLALVLLRTILGLLAPWVSGGIVRSRVTYEAEA
ncbi:MAG: hypothetical protein RL456_2739 [Pseudomonadota bacterium]|jgi:hypothetical protein